MGGRLALAGLGLLWASIAVAGPSRVEAAGWHHDVRALLSVRVDAEELPELARALGATRDPAVLPRLRLLATPSDPALQRAAVAAMGQVPGAAADLRALLKTDLAPLVRQEALASLGHVGAVDEVGLLVAAVGERSPRGAAAAEALGRLAVRGVPLEEGALVALSQVLDPLDPRAASAAFALYRSRALLAEAPASVIARLERAWSRQPRSEARAWLYGALLAAEPSERPERVLAALRGTDRQVVATALSLAQPGDLPEAVLRSLLGADDPWRRIHGERLARAAGLPVPLAEGGLSAETLAALDRVATEPAAAETLVGMLEQAPEPAVRSQIASALLQRLEAPPVASLLASADPVVQELAWIWLADHPEHPAWSEAPSVLGRADLSPALALAVLQAAHTAQVTLDPALVAGWAASPWAPIARAARRLTPELPVGTPAALPLPPELLDRVGKGTVHLVEVETSRGTLYVELDPAIAPLATAAFEHLADTGAFDGNLWHRVVPGFVAQTGDPRGDGLGGPPWWLPDEVSTLPFEAGSVGMARADRDTGSSQWFITLAAQPHLVGDYTRVGTVVRGLEVAQRLSPQDRILRARTVAVEGR